MPTIMLIKENFKQELKNQLLLIKIVNNNFGRWDDNNPYSKYGHIGQFESLISLIKNSRNTNNTSPFKESTSVVYEYLYKVAETTRASHYSDELKTSTYHINNVLALFMPIYGKYDDAIEFDFSTNL